MTAKGGNTNLWITISRESIFIFWTSGANKHRVLSLIIKICQNLLKSLVSEIGVKHKNPRLESVFGYFFSNEYMKC